MSLCGEKFEELFPDDPKAENPAPKVEVTTKLINVLVECPGCKKQFNVNVPVQYATIIEVNPKPAEMPGGGGLSELCMWPHGPVEIKGE